MVIAPPPTRLGMNVNINTYGLWWLWLLAIQQFHTIPWLLHHQAVCNEGMYFAIYVHNWGSGHISTGGVCYPSSLRFPKNMARQWSSGCWCPSSPSLLILFWSIKNPNFCCSCHRLFQCVWHYIPLCLGWWKIWKPEASCFMLFQYQQTVCGFNPYRFLFGWLVTIIIYIYSIYNTSCNIPVCYGWITLTSLLRHWNDGWQGELS